MKTALIRYCELSLVRIVSSHAEPGRKHLVQTSVLNALKGSVH